jgi:WD40 repeat protein
MFPDSLAYYEAVQNPRYCFSDPDLNAGQVVTNPQGLPLACSGNFAIVFRVTTSTGDWAVKCFTRDIANLQQRYHAVAEHLRCHNSRFFVPFDYQQQGIRVRGHWYPIVKMHWVNGLTLRDFIDRFLPKKRYIESIMYSLYVASINLMKKHIVHGDLQHGNIIIANRHDNGRTSYVLRLVDYDGMWVPSLKNLPPSEYGHRNYQHPGRLGYYGPLADRFSWLVLYTGLYAIQWNPRLWQECNTGENIVFSEKDFQHPEQSHLLQQLWYSSDKKLRHLVGHLVLSLYMYIEQVLPLSKIVRYTQPLAEPEVLPLERHQLRLIEQIFHRPAKPVIGSSFLAGVSPTSPPASPSAPYHLSTPTPSFHPSPTPGQTPKISSVSAPSPAASSESQSPQRTSLDGRSSTVAVSPKIAGRLVRDIVCHPRAAHSVTFSPVDSRLATIGDDGAIHICNLGSGQLLRTVDLPTLAATSLAFSADGLSLVSGNQDGLIQVWDANNGRCRLEFKAHPGWVKCVTFLGKGRRLASASMDNAIQIWDSITSQRLATLVGHSGEVWDIVGSSDGQYLVSGGSDHTVRVWEVATQRQIHMMQGHAGRIWAVAISPDGRWIVSGGWDETVRIWDVTSGVQVTQIGKDTGRVCTVTLSRDGQWLIYGGEDGKIAVWDFSSLSRVLLIKNLSAPVLCVTISPDNQWIAAALCDGSLLLWECSLK